MGYTPAGKLQGHDAALQRTFRSFSELTDPERLDVEPYKVELLKLDREIIVAEFNEKYPFTIPIERLAVVNGRADVPERIAAGTTVKRITGGKGAPNPVPRRQRIRPLADSEVRTIDPFDAGRPSCRRIELPPHNPS